jgi:predicted lipoprotein
MHNAVSNKMLLRKRKWIVSSAVFAIALITGMALDTKVIVNGSAEDLRKQAFSPDQYAQNEYPATRDFVLSKAVDANTLYMEMQADKTTTVEKYGVKSGIGSIIPIKLNAVVESGRSGIYTLTVANIPNKQTIRVQAGPAINGTDLRDATGQIGFGQFKNQIQYQDVGAAFNRVMKADILENIDQNTLVGKQVSIVGVFRLINTKNWLITPVRFDVK